VPIHAFARRVRSALVAGVLGLAAANAAFANASPAGDASLDLSAYRGKVVYLDFWASWCAPCRESFPWMQRMQQQYGRDGFVVVAVNVDHERSDADRFLHDFAPNFRVEYDPEGRLAERFGIGGMPTSVLIDRDGQVRRRHAGFRTKDPDVLEEQIRALLGPRH
jgi:cytochrome c biogenesis protein CcmG/thiol:disulfide interchange protein DsbE